MISRNNKIPIKPSSQHLKFHVNPKHLSVNINTRPSHSQAVKLYSLGFITINASVLTALHCYDNVVIKTDNAFLLYNCQS